MDFGGGGIEGDLHGVQAGVFQVLAHGAGQHPAVGVQPGHKPLGCLHQFDQIVAQSGFPTGEGQLGNARAAAFFNDGQPLVGVQFRRGAQGLVGGIAVQTFLVAVPGTVLHHGADHQVHAVGGVHPRGIVPQMERLDVQRRGLAPGHRTQAVQHQLQVGCDLQFGGAAVHLVGGGHCLGRDGRPVGGGQFLAAVGMQGIHQRGEQDGPADVQRQDILPVEDGHKGGLPVGVAAGDQMDANDAGTVGVQRHVAHTGKMPVQKGAFRIGQIFHRGWFLRKVTEWLNC